MRNETVSPAASAVNPIAVASQDHAYLELLQLCETIAKKSSERFDSG